MLPGQLSLWQLESVLDVLRNLRLKFGQNWVSISWNISDVEFPVLVGSCGVQSHFRVCPGLWITAIVYVKVYQLHLLNSDHLYLYLYGFDEMAFQTLSIKIKLFENNKHN